jgi:hypothetical protein
MYRESLVMEAAGQATKLMPASRQEQHQHQGHHFKCAGLRFLHSYMGCPKYSASAAPVVHGFVHAAAPHQERRELLLLLPKAVDAAQQLPQQVLAWQRAHHQQLAAAGQRQTRRLLVSLQPAAGSSRTMRICCMLVTPGFNNPFASTDSVTKSCAVSCRVADGE